MRHMWGGFFAAVWLGIGGGPAAASPLALLGPDGPAWFGPFPPDDRGGPVMVVNPISGAFEVEQVDGDGLIRRWSGGRWDVGGDRVTEDWPPRRLAAYELDGGELVAAAGADGIRLRYYYDEQGRLSGVQWPDGARLMVRYDAEGRVVETAGPGSSLTRFDWGEDGLRVRDALGRVWKVRSVPGGSLGDRGVELADPAGRVARTWRAADQDGVEHVSAWEDPRGLLTRVDRTQSGLSLIDPAGRGWHLSWDAAGRPLELGQPGGSRWRVERDGRGRIVSRSDPSGRVARWERDAQGLVMRASVGAWQRRFDRDSQGRVVGIVDGTGAETLLERDARGRVVRIQDAAGNSLRIKRSSGGAPIAIVSRTGGRWVLSTDLLGRIDRVVDPTDRIVVLERDSRGRLDRIVDQRFGTTAFAWGADGRLTRVTDSDGRRTGFVRDAAGRLRAVVRPDGTTVQFERDPAGEITSVVVGDREHRISRDPVGLPVALDGVSWRRDGAGNVDQISEGALRLKLRRDAAGWMSGASAGGWSVAVQRDSSGRPVEWSGSDGHLALRRDAAGRVVGEDDLRIRRDPRGLLNRVAGPRGTWSWMRDAAGRSLKLIGPDELQVGIDRDPAGRPVLIRLPGGGLTHLTWEGDAVHQRVEDPGGRVIVQSSIALDGAGRVRWSQVDDGERQAWRYDPLGRLIAVEGADGVAWSWTPDMVEGPDGELLVLDENGRLSEARPPLGPPAWGVAESLLSVFRDARGAIQELGGELGTAALRYDPLGRLRSVRVGADRWQLKYDPMGRLSAIDRPGGATDRLAWVPGADGSDLRGLLASGEDRLRAWIAGPSGLAGYSEAGVLSSVATMLSGDPVATFEAGAGALRIRHSPGGFPDSGGAALVGAGGTLQVFAGGPIFYGGVAMDPVSGQRLDGRLPSAWEDERRVGPGGMDDWDPSGWAPSGRWGEPLRLLHALGELPSWDNGAWVDGPALSPAFPWLPTALDAPRDGPGPEPTDLPLDDDPVTMALIAALLPGGAPPEPDLVLRTVLRAELSLDPLPPGLVVPGLELLHAVDGGSLRSGRVTSVVEPTF